VSFNSPPALLRFVRAPALPYRTTRSAFAVGCTWTLLDRTAKEGKTYLHGGTPTPAMPLRRTPRKRRTEILQGVPPLDAAFRTPSLIRGTLAPFGSTRVRAASEPKLGGSTVSDSGVIGQAYGRKIHAREVVAIDEAGDGLCWVRLARFGDEWLLIRSDAREVSRAVRKLRQIPAGEQSDRFPEVAP